MAKDLFNRYVWLVDTIYRAGHITFEEINDRWMGKSDENQEIPLRTFHNHRRAIQDLFDITVGCDKRNGYKYYIKDAEDIKHGNVRTWLLNTFAVNNLINESHKLKQRILFEQIPSGQQFLAPIIEAMRDNLTIEITYQRFWSNEQHTVEVQPFCVKVFRQRWYVAAFNPEKQKIWIYGLDRIKNFRTTENKFKLPEDFDAETFFNNCFGVIVNDGTEAENVLLKVSGNQDKYIRTLPLHHSQKEIETTNEYAVFKYFIKPTYDFRQEILSHGADIEVLSPQWFRDEIAEILKEQNKIYQKKVKK